MTDAWAFLFGFLGGMVAVGIVGFVLVKTGPRLLKRAMTMPAKANSRKRVKV